MPVRMVRKKLKFTLILIRKNKFYKLKQMNSPPSETHLGKEVEVIRDR